MTALTALMLLPPLPATAEPSSTLQLTMMDMMPMGGGGAAQPPSGAMPGMPSPPSASPAPGGRMNDDMMRMGGAAQGQAQPPMPMGQAQPPLSGCPMMATMMRDMMRMGAMPQGMQGGPSMGGSQSIGSSAARLEGRIAFLRTELGITGAQASAWEAFASTLRAGREHLDAARAALQVSTTAADPMERLASFENHLKERTEAIHLTRMAFGTLYGQLDDTQKRTATTIMLPFIGSF